MLTGYTLVFNLRSIKSAFYHSFFYECLNNWKNLTRGHANGHTRWFDTGRLLSLTTIHKPPYIVLVAYIFVFLISNLTFSTGIVCSQGLFLERDSSSSLQQVKDWTAWRTHNQPSVMTNCHPCDPLSVAVDLLSFIVWLAIKLFSIYFCSFSSNETQSWYHWDRSVV